MIEDNTDRKKVEEKLSLSEKRFKTIFEEAPLGVALIDSLNGQIYEVNPKFASIAGRTREEMSTINWMSITHPDDVQEDLDGMAELNAGKIDGFNMDKRYIKPDGSHVWIHMTIAPITVEDKAKPRHLCMIQDITEKKQVEKELETHRNHLEKLVKARTNELKRSETSLINLISNLNGMVYNCKNDKDWTMDFVSSGSLELTGYRPGDIERNNMISYNEIIHPDDREAVWDNVQEALKNKVPFILHYRITTSEGKIKYVWEQGRGVWSNSGELEGLQGFITDITKQVDAEQQIKNSQAQLVHMEKLSALGKLTGSISHEFNNPLQGIRNTIAILSRSALSEKEVQLAKLGKKECDRMGKMIRGLRDFYKPTSGKFSFIDINQCMEEVLALQIRSLTERSIQVNQQFSDNLPQVEVVEDQIKQVVLNLVLNAADSISGEGQITLATEKQDSHVAIRIQDTGLGISEDDKQNLFEPFFTTKETEQGTGLGLSISYGIVQDHGGDIEVESELDKGTTFTVRLPIKRE